MLGTRRGSAKMCYLKGCIIENMWYSRNVLSKRWVILQKVCYFKRFDISEGMLSTKVC